MERSGGRIQAVAIAAAALPPAAAGDNNEAGAGMRRGAPAAIRRGTEAAAPGEGVRGRQARVNGRRMMLAGLG